MNRASYYYQPCRTSELNLKLMKLLDELYTRTPFYGVSRMTVWLRRQDYQVNRKRVARLMRLMGLQAIYPKPNMSRKRHDHKIYPYLLRDVEIVHPDQVWSTDITYIRMKGGFEVSNRNHRLVQSLCFILALVKHTGRIFLHRSASGSFDLWDTRSIQHGSGFPVYQRQVHRHSKGS